jgi:ligand-binding sensor domain-containing protein
MKRLCSILLLLITCASYSQPAKTDPYFVKSFDTVSTFGPSCITRYILEDKKGNIWFATWQGIVKYDGKVFTNYTLKEGLIPFHVYSLMEDRSGNIWFGTVRGGAYKYNGKTFTLFTTNDGLADDLIGCMMEDKTGIIWFGTDAGISRCDTSVLFKTSTRPGITTISGLPLNSKKGFTTYTSFNGLCGDRVNSIIQDKSGKIWIATRSGVSCYDGKSFTNFTNKGVPFTNVRCMKEDKNGKIWIGGQDGLYCYDPIAYGETALTQLLPNFICYIFEDKAGHFWISTGERDAAGGMALYTYDRKKFTKLLVKNEAGDSQIFEITEDKNGLIWFGTMQGPCRYDGKTFTYFRK